VEKIKKYLKETAAELRKMTWPTKDELVGSTIVTVVVSVIVAAFIGVVDRLLLLVIHQVFGSGGTGI
jgi:preprotein translocase subunit SecE